MNFQGKEKGCVGLLNTYRNQFWNDEDMIKYIYIYIMYIFSLSVTFALRLIRYDSNLIVFKIRLPYVYAIESFSGQQV